MTLVYAATNIIIRSYYHFYQILVNNYCVFLDLITCIAIMKFGSFVWFIMHFRVFHICIFHPIRERNNHVKHFNPKRSKGKKRVVVVKNFASKTLNIIIYTRNRISRVLSKFSERFNIFLFRSHVAQTKQHLRHSIPNKKKKKEIHTHARICIHTSILFF